MDFEHGHYASFACLIESSINKQSLRRFVSAESLKGFTMSEKESKKKRSISDLKKSLRRIKKASKASRGEVLSRMAMNRLKTA